LLTAMPDRSTPTQPSHRGRQALFWLLKIVVSGGLLYLLLRRVDLDRLWTIARGASLAWIGVALALYFLVMVISAWRWGLLLDAQHTPVSFGMLLNSYLVAGFFSNFLPSNIGGDVIRIRDTVPACGSKTLASLLVLVDRGIGLLGLTTVAAIGATVTARASDTVGPVGPGILWGIVALAILGLVFAVSMPQAVAALLKPLRALHQEWVGERIGRLVTALGKFRDAPRALVGGLIGSLLVQGILVLVYAAVAQGLHLHVPLSHLAIVVPVSFIVQMLPVSVNGFGVREATFGFYFTKMGEPLEAGVALSFISAVMIMAFSVTGAIALLTRGRASRDRAVHESSVIGDR
jgi:uncharacterized membrane protein YbhN (UPF0104 family)